MLSTTSLKQTPLHKEHLLLKAKMVPFGVWEMPLQYDGILAEYEYTRKDVSIFDTSHMGEFFIDGDAKDSGLDRIVTQTIADMPVKTCRYGLTLNEQGGAIDDLIVYRLSQERWMIVVNGATTEKDAKHFLKHLTTKGKFDNRSDKLGKLDIQGPRSREILRSLVEDIEKLDYYTFDEFEVLGQRVIVSRTGYTGELGFEIYFPWERTVDLWREILKRGGKPAGLGARDVLRIEMGYPLYGHELEENISPLDAGLNKFIDWNKDFLGKAALEKVKTKGQHRQAIAFISMNRRSPRAEKKIFSTDGKTIGVVTSGSFSPALNRGIGLGMVARDSVARGQKIFWGDENDKLEAEIASRPFYKNGSFKK